MNLEELGEFGLIRRIMPHFPAPPECHQGIGDDCAVLPWDEDRVQLVTTDLLLENTHFLRDRISPEDLGHKALAVNLSDIAAMGGVPVAAFLSIGVPAGMEVEWLDRFFAGIHGLSAQSSCPLLGGDTTRSQNGIVINFAVLGTARRTAVKYRSTARPGDVAAVTGFLGDSGAGLRLLLGNHPIDSAGRRYLLQAHHHPMPHLAEGAWLGGQEAVHAMMDVSDGIDSDLRRIMEQSGVGARVEVDALPVSGPMAEVCRDMGWPVREIAVAGGEDYCLLVTVDPGHFSRVSGNFHATFGRPLTAIGIIDDRAELSYLEQGREVIIAGHGFDHFRKTDGVAARAD